MSSSNIAKRYARAFFDIAREDGLYEKYYNELTVFLPSSKKIRICRNYC